jgi:hypothetical protein
LYEKNTHFLLELVQNADDNNYNHNSPTVVISYRNRRLQVSCNEVGFQRRNVEAVCRIGRSTKAGGGNATRYIGEKGIGFKSVFKVADTVWIQSRHYQFKFDKREKLGMIAPVWSRSPEPGRAGFTSITLQLSPDQDDTDLINELRGFDPRILIFLRRLREIKIFIEEKGGSSWATTLARHDEIGPGNDHQVITLRSDNNAMKYLTTSHTVTQLPHDEKRAGCSSSHILLAFPVSENGSPEISPQHVFAFLPVRDYGFKVSTYLIGDELYVVG